MGEVDNSLSGSSHYKQALKIIKKHAYDREEYEDRDVLERIIFPYLLKEFDPKRILDIGREDYQKFYNLFFKGRELWTLDIDPERKEFGSKNHIVDDVKNVDEHFKEGYLDVVIMNGVFGWGLNDPENIERAISGIYTILRDGGIFIMGWNDVPDLVPISLDLINALRKFEKYYFSPLNSVEFKSNTGEHVYSFFIKKNLILGESDSPTGFL